MERRKLISEDFFSAEDGTRLFFHRWLPELPARGVVQIAHGLAEHAGRYARLAAALNSAGYAVYAHDHRGHGRSASEAHDLGFFAAQKGWRKCVEDLRQVNSWIAAEHPGTPIVLLGHSMGSFLVQDFLAEHGATLAGAVLSGSNGRPEGRAKLGKFAARLERIRVGARGRSGWLAGQAFGAYNRPFEPARTAFDWLTRDAAEVDAYLADPYCGFRPTVQLWIDLLEGWARLSRPERQARIRKDLPIDVIAGTADPVGENGRGVKRLLEAYQAAGLTEVTHRFYAGARHELFHETNREEVTRELVAWLDEVVRRPRTSGNRGD